MINTFLPIIFVTLFSTLEPALSTSGTSTTAHQNPKETQRRRLVVAVDGGTESIRACCFDATNGEVVGKSCASPYPTYHPEPGWAEQNPLDWYKNLGEAVRRAIQSVSNRDNKYDENPNSGDEYNYNINYEICAICLDTTCCSVVALDEHYEPLRPCLLWMDARAASQTQEILRKAKGDPALQVNCGGQGPLSAEWMTPKSLWIRQREPATWEKARTICEYQDFLNYKLTGEMCASSCNAATRWHWDGETCIFSGNQKDKKGSKNTEDENLYPGRPLSLYKTIGIPELADKLPQKCISMGSLVGKLTKEAANHLNLPQGIPVIQGGPDAFVGMIGLGCIHPGQLCLITGSSHLHCVVSSKPTSAPGTWGAYRGAPLPGINFAEGGQSSTGSVIRWARGNLFSTYGNNKQEEKLLSYKQLDEEAASIAPGCDGLVALETFQGSRTPITDPMARGALLGLTLSHTRAHVWRAFMEAVCFGTRSCIEGLTQANHKCDEIIIAGGASRSQLWLQMHADITGKPVVVCENSDAPLLGCAILAAVGVGIHDSVSTGVDAMVRTAHRIEPDESASILYSVLHEKIYKKVSDAVRPVAHAMADLRKVPLSSSSSSDARQRQHQSPDISSIQGIETRGGAQVAEKEKAIQETSVLSVLSTKKERSDIVVSPSLLACDWSNVQAEVHRCIDAGVNRFHVDIFDGVFLDSPLAFTFGPEMVQAIRRSCDNYFIHNDNNRGHANSLIDLHVCVDRPSRYVKPMADAGADTFIFQWEATVTKSTMTESGNENAAVTAAELAEKIVSTGMKCGVSINPGTNVEDIYPLLETGLVDVVDILAVEPGFGGQTFQPVALEKLRTLLQWKVTHRNSTGLTLDLMVDGGVNQDTASSIVQAGADILVAGSFLFRQRGTNISQGIRDLVEGKDSSSSRTEQKKYQ